MMSKLTRAISVLMIAATSLLLANPATAASQCKGLSSSSCSANSGCSWVDSFTRKDGVKVKAHCRTKPKKSGSSSKSDSKKSDSKSSSKPSSEKKSSSKKDDKKPSS
jgi:spermidine/putrescine-binding protein